MKTYPKIFLDSGSAAQTREVVSLYPQLAGQTTNPTLIAQSSEIQQRITAGEKFTPESLMDMYRTTVEEMAECIPDGDISIEVYADKDSSTESLVSQGMVMSGWTKNARVKLPITHAGISAAQELLSQGIRINMTLCFSVDQAVALHFATAHLDQTHIVISPFVGRLDDIGIDGVSLIDEIKKAYTQLGSKISILAASIRTTDHIIRSSNAGADILTLPKKVFDMWQATDFSFEGAVPEVVLVPVVFAEQAETDWKMYNINHELTTKGLAKFAEDWNSLLA